MTRFLILLTLFVSAAVAAPGADSTPAAGIAWELDLNAALARSAAENKPVMVYFRYDGCPWCSRMERDVFSDSRVTAAAGRFIWVKLDRELNLELHDKFSVNEYPTLLALNAARQNVNRVKGFRETDGILSMLSESVERYRRLAAGEELPDVEPSRDLIADLPGMKTLPTPLQDVPTGMCALGDDLWIVQNKILHQIDKNTGEVKFSVPTQATISDLTTDGEVLFLAAFGWTKGEPIIVFHPGSGKFVRHIVTSKYRDDPRGYRTHGIAFHDGSLWVLGLGQLHRVDPTTGEIISWKSVDPQYRSLQSVGNELATGGPGGVAFLNPDTLTVARQIPTRRHVRNIAADDTQLFLVGQPEYDFDRDNNRVLAWPPEMMVFRAPFDAAAASQSTRVE